MRPKELLMLIANRFAAGIKRPILVESAPGLGKTQIAKQCAKQLNIGFRMIHAPLLQPEDYGFPVVNSSRDNVEFIVSQSKFPTTNSNCEERGIFVIDELSQCDNSAQKILANLIQEREIHGQKIKDGWAIVATGNRSIDRAGANRILTHLKNRLTTIELEASLDDWTQWALENGVKAEVIAFIRFRPELLSAFDPKNEVNATPRAWAEGVSAALGSIPAELEFSVFKGDVGEGPASEFLGFLKIFRKLPNPDLILVDPKNSPVPSDPATLFALTGALVNRATKDNFGALMAYVDRIPPEFSVLFVRDCLQKDKTIAETKAFIAWTSANGASLLT